MEFIMANGGQFLAILGATISIIMAGIGSAKGVRIAGEAASGVVSEEPDKFGQCILLQALPATQGIYGTLIAFVVMLRLGLLEQKLNEVGMISGLVILLGGLIMGLVGLISAIHQGRVAAAGIGIVAKQPNEAAKGMIFTAMVETYAVFALLISFLLIYFVPLTI